MNITVLRDATSPTEVVT